METAYLPYPPPSRPLGVSVLAVLYFLAGIFILLLGILVVVGSVALGLLLPGPLSSLGLLLAVIGLLVLLFGVLGIAVGWGLWTLKRWARGVALAFSILGLLYGLLSLASDVFAALPGLVISALITWYLFTEGVRRAFGLLPAAAPSPYYPPAYPVPPELPPAPPAYGAPAAAACRQCGATLLPGAQVCMACGAPVG